LGDRKSIQSIDLLLQTPLGRRECKREGHSPKYFKKGYEKEFWREEVRDKNDWKLRIKGAINDTISPQLDYDISPVY